MNDMGAWCRKNRRNPAVRQWLADNPPPPDWQGSKLQWAFTEGPFGGRNLVIILAISALISAGIAWYFKRKGQ